MAKTVKTAKTAKTTKTKKKTAKKAKKESGTTESRRSILTLPLHTEVWQEHIIEKRFAIIEHLKNSLIAMELRKLQNLERTREYRAVNEAIQALYAIPKNERIKTWDNEYKELLKKKNTLLDKAGFNRETFKNDMGGKKSKMQKHFSEHIATQIAHMAASDVWHAFEKMLFNTGQDVHFHKKNTLNSVACQKIGNGMHYKDGVFTWSGGKSVEHHKQITLTISVEQPRNEYEREMLKKKIKYMRVVRKWMKTRYKYYLQLTLEGPPIQKDRPLGQGRVGIDIGPQTVAIASAEKVMLLELADRVNRNHQKKLILQRKMDSSRRRTNSDNYKPDGTIKKGIKLWWVQSRHYKKLAGQVRELERKNAAIRKYQHTCLANEILSLGNEIYVEQMSFSGLQRRAKETKKDEKGHFMKKKRFGKSLANKAPAAFLTILSIKAQQVGATYNTVNTTTFKASQLDHTNTTYKAHPLSERRRELSDGSHVQRDLYSAFLLMNSASNLEHSDIDLCKQSFPAFKLLHDAEIDRIRQANTAHPSSFGV